MTIVFVVSGLTAIRTPDGIKVLVQLLGEKIETAQAQFTVPLELASKFTIGTHFVLEDVRVEAGNA
jgi:hypothetical protein